MTSEFVKASDRAAVPPFSLIEHKGLLARLTEEFIEAAGELTHDPYGYLHSLVSIDSKDQKRRRVIYFGLALGLVAHTALLGIMVVAGWHRIMESPPEEAEAQQVTWLPRTNDVRPDRPADLPKGERNSGGGGGGQQEQQPASQGVPPQRIPLPPLVQINPSQIAEPTLAVAPTIQGFESPPPPPGANLGDPAGKPRDFSAGPGKGGGVGGGSGPGVGSGKNSGVGPGGRVDKGGGRFGSPDVSGPVTALSYIGKKPPGYVPFSWIRRVTPAITPEAQANKVSGTIVLMATFHADGTISDIEIRNTVDFMTESAIEALRRSKFRPAMLNGTPITLYRVPIKIEVTVNDR